MLRYSLPTHLLTLTVAAALLGPIAATAQTPPPTPATPTVPATPPAPTAPAPTQNNRVRGKISTVDATKKTITVVGRRATVTLSVPDDAKIYKADDAKGSPTGTFADLTVDTMIAAQTNGDETAPVAKTIHIRVPKTATPAAPAVPATPPAPAQ